MNFDCYKEASNTVDFRLPPYLRAFLLSVLVTVLTTGITDSIYAQGGCNSAIENQQQVCYCNGVKTDCATAANIARAAQTGSSGGGSTETYPATPVPRPSSNSHSSAEGGLAETVGWGTIIFVLIIALSVYIVVSVKDQISDIKNPKA
jgi:hypothetical protein